MNDNEFFSQFPASPRPEFMDALRLKLAQIDPVHEVESLMDAPSLPFPAKPLSVPRPSQSRSRVVSLVASLLLVLFLGTALALNANQRETALPLAPMGTPVVPVISKDNASQLHHVVQIGEGNVYAAVWSPDDRWFVTQSSTGLRVYDATDLTAPLYHIYPELSLYDPVAFSANGRYLAFTNDSKVYMWDLVEQKEVSGKRSGIQPASAVALNADGRILAVATMSSKILFYDTQTNTRLGEIPFDGLPPLFVMDIQFNADATALAFFGIQEDIYIYSDPSGTWTDLLSVEPMILSPDEEGYVQSLNYSPDGSRLGARIGNAVIVWDTDPFKEVARLKIAPAVSSMSDGGFVRSVGGDVTFNADGTQFLMVDEKIWLWDIDHSSSRTLIEQNLDFEYPGVRAATFNPDWTQFVLVLPNGEVQLRDMVNDQPITTISDYTLRYVYDLAFSPDGLRLASAGGTQQLLLWNISDLSRIPEPSLMLQPYQNPNLGWGVQNVAFSPNNQFVATFRPSGMRNIQLWNSDGTSANTWTTEADPQVDMYAMPATSSLVYSADGARLLAMNSEYPLVRLWDTATGEVIRRFDMDEGRRNTFSALSPDGQFVAIADYALRIEGDPTKIQEMVPSEIVIYDAATGEAVHTLTGHKGEIRNIVYSPDGASLVSFSENGAVYLWDVATGEMIHQLLTAWGGSALTFSPDGQLIAGVSIDNMHLTLWETATGEQVALLPEISAIHALAFSADGRRLAAGLANGTIQIWGLEAPR